MRYLPVFILLIACSRRTPQVIYQDHVSSRIDTINFVHHEFDTVHIPCLDFTDTMASSSGDTVVVQVVKERIKVVTKVKHDSIFISPTIITQPNIRIRKIDNSVTAKKGSIIGDGNTMTTKKSNWWWIFVSGMLTWFIIQNIVIKTLKTYFPFLRILP